MAWGLCKECKWWQIEPDDSARAGADATVDDNTMGLCIDEQLQPFRLRVSGNSGCDVFMAGEPARAEGSSGQPPTAEPQR